MKEVLDVVERREIIIVQTYSSRTTKLVISRTSLINKIVKTERPYVYVQ